MILELNYLHISDLLMCIEIARANPTMPPAMAEGIQKLLEEKLPDALDEMVDHLPEGERADVLQRARELEETKFEICERERNFRIKTARQIILLEALAGKVQHGHIRKPTKDNRC